MGCFNGTCGLTNVPIRLKERVIMFILVRNTYEGYVSFARNNHDWEVLPVPFYGSYNEYGWFNEDDDQEHKLQYLNEVYPSLAFTSFEEMDKHTRGYPFTAVKQSMMGERIIGKMFIREDAMNLMLKPVLYTGYGESGYYLSKEYLCTLLQAYIDHQGDVDIDAVYEEQKLLKDSSDPVSVKRQEELSEMVYRYYHKGEDYYEFAETTMLHIRKTFKMDSDSLIDAPDYDLLSYISGKSGSEFGYYTNNILRNQWIRRTLAHEELVDSFLVNKMFIDLRKSYSVQGGQGSSEDETECQKQFADIYRIVFNNMRTHDPYDVGSSEDIEYQEEYHEALEQYRLAVEALQKATQNLMALQ